MVPDMAKKKAAKKRVNKKVCRLCGHPLGETFVYSRFTKSRYCVSMDACDKRRAAQGAPRRGNRTSADNAAKGTGPIPCS